MSPLTLNNDATNEDTRDLPHKCGVRKDPLFPTLPSCIQRRRSVKCCNARKIFRQLAVASLRPIFVIEFLLELRSSRVGITRGFSITERMRAEFFSDPLHHDVKNRHKWNGQQRRGEHAAEDHSAERLLAR